MIYQGDIRKMLSELHTPVQYQLPIGADVVAMNGLLGTTVRLVHDGTIHCISCGRKTNKSFNQGYCFPCMRGLAECDTCIVRPELCHFDKGTCRDAQWALNHCMQPHIVYLANSSGIKVGITRQSQIPTRWIDQGATQAVPIYSAGNRYISGLVEVIIKQHVADKTDWRKMLKGATDGVDLAAKRQELVQICQGQIQSLRGTKPEAALQLIDDAAFVSIEYPVQDYPCKVTSLSFDKTPDISGKLLGIKGQYLILDCGVLNIRKFAGYHIEFHT
jgi:hypothetical protein